MYIFSFRKHDVFLREYIEKTILAMEDQKLLYMGHPFSDNSIKNWRKFLKLWTSFETGSGVHYKVTDIVSVVSSSFLRFCNSRNYTDNTKKLYSSLLIAIMNRAIKDGITSINIRKISHIKEQKDTNVMRVYLSEEELRKIELLDLGFSAIDCLVRDIFLIGCYTGQRYSDYRNITTNDIVHVNAGGIEYPVLKIKQQKTGVEVLVPINSQKVVNILQKWGGFLPKVSLSAFDRHIKNICKLAGITEKVQIEKPIGGMISREMVAKYKLISSHTARRTCITQLHLDGRLTPNQIRSISGHKTEKAFAKYLCQSKEDAARSIIKTLGLNM